MAWGAVDVWRSVGRNLSLYIVLFGAAISTGLFGANWRLTQSAEPLFMY